VLGAGGEVLEGRQDHAVRVEVALEGWLVVGHWGPECPEDLGDPGVDNPVVEYVTWAVFVAEVDRLGSPAVVVVAAGHRSFVGVVAAVVAAVDNLLVVDVEVLVPALAADTLETAVNLHTLVAAVAVAFAVSFVFLPVV